MTKTRVIFNKFWFSISRENNRESGGFCFSIRYGSGLDRFIPDDLSYMFIVEVPI